MGGTSASLRTTAATATGGRPCHSFTPTQFFSPSSMMVRPLAGPSVTTSTAPRFHSNSDGSMTAASAAASWV